ncbi:hypothetical protein NKDENANG_03371 [Candidatus Entotheonellaceae bacterium PAL068K]
MSSLRGFSSRVIWAVAFRSTASTRRSVAGRHLLTNIATLSRIDTSQGWTTWAYQGRKPLNERFAESFGMSFLMPTMSVRRRFNEMVSTTGDFYAADLCRLSHLYRYSERYIYLTVHAYEQAKISEGQLAQFLAVDPVTAREMVERVSQIRDVMDDGSVEACRLDSQQSLLANVWYDLKSHKSSISPICGRLCHLHRYRRRCRSRKNGRGQMVSDQGVRMIPGKDKSQKPDRRFRLPMFQGSTIPSPEHKDGI